MSATITPVAATSNVQALQPVQGIAVVAAKLSDGMAQNVLLQPGAIMQAQVADVGIGGQVKIALAGVVIDALSEVPLTVGASLRLSVSQANDGVVRLSIVPTDGTRAQGAGGAAALVVTNNPNVRGAGATAIDMSSSSSANLKPTLASSSSAIAQSSTPSLETSQRSAVTQALMQAMQNAAPRQQSLAPLFANVSALAQSGVLPASVQQAAIALLAMRTKLDDGLSAQHIKQAVVKSGIFLESNLATQGMGLSQGGQQAMPDLKAALLVMRETLALWHEGVETQSAPSTQAGLSDAAALEVPPNLLSSNSHVGAEKQGARMSSPSLVPDDALIANETGEAAMSSLTAHAPPKAESLSRMLELTARKQAAVSADGLQALLLDPAEGTPSLVFESGQAKEAVSRLALARADDNRADAPPPMRAGITSAQAVVMPTLSGDDAPLAIARQLLDETDGALARQTLLQAASLPDANDQSARIDAGPRWQFEIPFVTQQGTAMAHFEVSRDAPEQQVDATKPVWRVRFSVAMEPAGPVHVSVVYNGERTHVRMWAERDETATRLRDQSSALAQALRNAELDPGEIVVGEGAPPRPRSNKPSGVFLDRAT